MEASNDFSSLDRDARADTNYVFFSFLDFTSFVRSTTEYFEKLLRFILGYRKFYWTSYRFLEL